jgi:hypothetical protein
MTNGFEGLDRFIVKMEHLERGLLPAVAAHAHDSIVSGSPVTGAPGQPVDTGALRNSWQLRFPTKDVAEITTNLVYAPMNEYGVTEDGRPYRQLSPVGGRHSVAHTITNFDRIVEFEAKRLSEGG